ncbi:carboxylesterase 5A-like [Mytilus californianus]|uniref:carboxylesterase 5A-like n=1 Tax=Mytilus californianus TaxID=6549 RepID=UPI002245594F|nr:carboxylesterase 5A-like [Mytilus californianus]
MYLDLNTQITLKRSMKPETIKLWSEIYPLIEVAEGIPNQITITTPSGPIRGLKRTDPKRGESVFEFLGIPYAKPPVGQRRFQKPQPIGNWIHTLNATLFGAACSQNVPEFEKTSFTSGISEDCLFLNIHIPKVISKTKLYSVMIWIHGGGFELGYGHQDDVTEFAMTGNVIVVTLNYRFGVFGFFAMDHPAARGNFGLWDQKLAIQWVHDNIKAFGGNPDSVTIFGESAGAMSTSLQSLIPANKGLFQRVICQSGVHSKILMRKSEAIREYATGLANRTGCSIDDEYAFVDCLRNLSVQDLLSYTDFYATAQLDKVHYMSDNYPVVDGELFPENPILSLEDPTSAVATFFRSLDMIAGTTSNEGSILVVTLFPQIQERFNFSLNEGIPHRVACEEVIAEYVKTYLKQNEEVKRQLCDFYFVANSPNEQSNLATHLLADIMFVYPTIRMLELHSMYGATTYHYQFSMPSPEPWGGPFPSWFNGSGHADELIYMFRPEVVSTDGMKLSRNLIQYWTTFARTGSPNGYTDSVVWIPFDIKEREYLDLNAEIMMKVFLKPDTVKLWSEVYPLIDVGQTTAHASTTTTSRPSTTQLPVCISNDDISSVATKNNHCTIILYILFFKAILFNSLQ